MTIREFTADCIRFARDRRARYLILACPRSKNEEHKAIYFAMFKKAFPNLGLV